MTGKFPFSNKNVKIIKILPTKHNWFKIKALFLPGQTKKVQNVYLFTNWGGPSGHVEGEDGWTNVIL